MKSKMGCLILMMAGMAAGQTPRPLGVIRGVVRDTAGGPLRGAVVVVSTEPGARRLVPFWKYAVTDAQGRFEVKNVPAGEFRICPQLGSGEYINPCIWENQIPRAVIGTRGPRAVAEMTFRMERGATVYVSVRDPQRALEKEERFKRGQRLGVGLRTARGDYDPGRQQPGTAGQQRMYRLVVPYNRPFRPVIEGSAFDLDHGAKGNQFGRDTVVRPGDAVKVIEVNVKGKKA